MEHYFHIDLNDNNYMVQIQNMVNQLQTSINTYQNNQSQQTSPNSSQNQENYLIQFEFDIEVPQQNNQEDLPNYFKNCAEIEQELGPALYIQKKDPIIDKKECLICMEKFKYKKYKRILHCCNNIYHKKCIDKWLKKNSTCPTCRHDFLNKNSESLDQQEEEVEQQEEEHQAEEQQEPQAESQTQSELKTNDENINPDQELINIEEQDNNEI